MTLHWLISQLVCVTTYLELHSAIASLLRSSIFFPNESSKDYSNIIEHEIDIAW